MDTITTSSLRELIAADAGPAVSIYIATDPTRDHRASRLKFREHAERVLGTIEEEHGAEVARTFNQYLSDRKWDDRDFWMHAANGLAIFLGPDFERTFRLPVAFDDQSFVNDEFYIRPLLEQAQRPSDFFLLTLSRKRARLHRGDSQGLEVVEVPDMPESLTDALGEEVDQAGLSYHSSSRGGRDPIYHGHGSGKDDRGAEDAKYLAMVARAVERATREGGPLFLAGDKPLQATFRRQWKGEALTDLSIEGNVDHHSEPQLHEATGALLEQYEGQVLEQAVERLDHESGVFDLDEVSTQAARGRVRQLLCSRYARVWGTVDPAGAIQRQESDVASTEVLNRICALVLQHGGEVLSLPGDMMPNGAAAVALLR